MPTPSSRPAYVNVASLRRRLLARARSWFEAVRDLARMVRALCRAPKEAPPPGAKKHRPAQPARVRLEPLEERLPASESLSVLAFTLGMGNLAWVVGEDGLFSGGLGDGEATGTAPRHRLVQRPPTEELTWPRFLLPPPSPPERHDSAPAPNGGLPAAIDISPSLPEADPLWELLQSPPALASPADPLTGSPAQGGGSGGAPGDPDGSPPGLPGGGGGGSGASAPAGLGDLPSLINNDPGGQPPGPSAGGPATRDGGGGGNGQGGSGGGLGAQGGSGGGRGQLVNLSRKPGLVRLPLRFEENRGQVPAKVDYLARGPGYALYLTQEGATLSLAKPDRSQTDAGVTPNVVRMHLVNGKAGAASAASRLATTSNYFRGDDPSKWLTGVANFGRVSYRDVYDNIDLVYYGTSESQLEYDFVVKPRGRPGDIRLRFDGVKEVSLDAAGNLRVGGPGSGVAFQRPVIYQDDRGQRRDIHGRYVLHGKNEVGFEVGDYDDGLHAVAVDAQGNGPRLSPDYPPFCYPLHPLLLASCVPRAAVGSFGETGCATAALPACYPSRR